MRTVQDEEFGVIKVRTSSLAKGISIGLAPDGSLRASMPKYVPLYVLKRTVDSSRQSLRTMISKFSSKIEIIDGMDVGKSHRLYIRPTTAELRVARPKQQIVLYLPGHMSVADNSVSTLVREHIRKSLRIQAKSYLPRRLETLARRLGVSYEKVRFSHTTSRWGSYSSSGTLSLNIAIMKLPWELIDHVLIHELCHIVHLNHSREFWALVAESDPNWQKNRKALKSFSPII